MSYEKTGIPSSDMIESVFPSYERLMLGAVAVAECYRRIPCNPCESSCRFGAITVGQDINNTPTVDFDKCRGCGICLTKCPGLAIMLAEIKGETAEITIPYEFLPLPCSNDTVRCLDRSGEYVCDGTVVSIKNPPAFDRTPLVCVSFPKQYIREIRNISMEANK